MVVNDFGEILLLHRKDHDHYETPGGKVSEKDLSPESKEITEDVLRRAAIRELREEVGEYVKIGALELFVNGHEFNIPDGRKAVVYKFVTHYKVGLPRIMEPDKFDRFDWIPIRRIERYNVSPDLKDLSERIKAELI